MDNICLDYSMEASGTGRIRFSFEIPLTIVEVRYAILNVMLFISSTEFAGFILFAMLHGLPVTVKTCIKYVQCTLNMSLYAC